MSNQLVLIMWNVYVKHKPAKVLKQLKKLAKKHKPDVFVLSEAAHCFGVLDDLPGYTRIQAKPDGAEGRLLNEDGNTAILVRTEHLLIRQHPVRMDEKWIGPKAGLPHEARVYHSATVEVRGQRWRVLGDHFPTLRRNEKAVAESKARVKRWLYKSDTTPSIAAGDKNMLKATLMKAVRAKVRGYRIDLAAYTNCNVVRSKKLGRHGSDHPAVLMVFER